MQTIIQSSLILLAAALVSACVSSEVATKKTSPEHKPAEALAPTPIPAKAPPTKEVVQEIEPEVAAPEETVTVEVVEEPMSVMEMQAEPIKPEEPKSTAPQVSTTPPPKVVTIPGASGKTPSMGVTATKPVAPPSPPELKQQLAYAKLMFMSKTSKRIAASDNQDAKNLLEASKRTMDQANAAFEAGDLEKAQALVSEGMFQFTSASRLIPSESVIAEQKQRYEMLQKQLEESRVTHRKTYQAMQAKQAAVDYDEGHVSALEQQAQQQVARGNYEAAAKHVEQANELVVAATSKMLHEQTIRYELKLDTPEDEYKYELDRYIGYEELIDIAIEQKQPSQGQLMLVNRSADKGRKMAEAARQKAAEGDYPVAIRMVIDATDEIRRALRIMGITQ